MTTHDIDPKLDLVFERIVNAPPALLWKAWTTPEHLKQWFTPAPWTTVDCEIDLRPGGLFRTVMRSPEGEEHPNIACYLEITENQKLVWTDALGPNYRPAPQPNECFNRFFTATVLFEPHEKGCLYMAIARHADEDGRREHEKQGFHEGWGAAFDQMLVLIKSQLI